MNRKVSFNLAAIFVLFLLMGTNVRAATETTNSATDEFAEGKALDAVGVIADRLEHVRMHHAAAHDFQPAFAAARRAAAAAAGAGEE